MNVPFLAPSLRSLPPTGLAPLSRSAACGERRSVDRHAEGGERGEASAVGGLPEIVVDDQTGLVVPSADADALADAIVALAGNLSRAAAMGIAGRERALAQFTPEQCVARIEELYSAALGRAAA